jgi:hypothetical protein
MREEVRRCAGTYLVLQRVHVAAVKQKGGAVLGDESECAAFVAW